jgi:hypothetical protein
MLRTAVLLGLTGLCLSCCTTPERLAVPPLPGEGQGASYADILTRLRLQSGSANEAFFVDDFPQLASRARDIEQTAAYLPKATDAPKPAQPRLATESAKLTAEARRLAGAADAKNDDQIRDSLRKIHTQIRTLPAP